MRSLRHRASSAIVCLAAFLCGMIPLHAQAFDEQARALKLLDGQTCAQMARSAFTLAQTSTDSPTPSASPEASPTSLPPLRPGTSTLYVTPPPVGAPQTTPPPVPTPTPSANPSGLPVIIYRDTGETPPPITPAGEPAAAPSARPTGEPTLAPGFVAIVADKMVGNKNPGQPGDAYGNVHVFYQTGELVGDHAHYDGLRTITVTGHPYLINRAKDTVYGADTIEFDAIDSSAKLLNGKGESSEGVDRGLVHFSSPDLHTDPDGVGHGSKAYITTCENPRGGYHVTGKTLTEYPGDKIVITDAILWLGAAAVFFLPRLVIPLRSNDETISRPSYFPEVGYSQDQGAYIKVNYAFGKDRYYYGYYRLEYYTKVGLGLGYTGYFAKKNGRRSGMISYYGIHDRRVGTTTHNLSATEQVNFSRTLQGNFSLSYNGNYGPLLNIPPTTSINLGISHSGAHSQQQYSFVRSATGSQSQSNTVTLTDTRQITSRLRQSEQFSLSNSDSSISGYNVSNTSAHFNSVTNFTTAGANYQMTVDKTYQRDPSGILDKLPELQIVPTNFFKNFVIPIRATFTMGEYAEPGAPEGYVPSTGRAALSFNIGPGLYRVFNSTLNVQGNVTQFAYGTGDLKAAITQALTLNTPIGKHILNTLSYGENNYNGPNIVPFQQLDLQPGANNHNAQDTITFFNNSIYNFQVNYSTAFNGIANPVTYQLNVAPSPRSVVILGGAFSPGSGQGFQPTQVQFLTPLGYETTVAFSGTVDWQNHARIENKNIYISKIIGECYEVRLNYLESAHLLNVEINLLAFPTRGANFGVGQGGSVIPGTLNP
jgi:hypothetical protein